MEEFSYRSNSHKSKEEQEPEKKDIHKIVSGRVVQKKKNGFQKFLGDILSGDPGSIKASVVNDIIVPVIKEAIANLFENGSGMVNTLLFGESRKEKKSSRISYRGYYESDKRTVQRTKNTYDFDSIVIGNRGEAEEVLDKLDEIIDVYGAASVSDFYELVGVTGNYTDNKFGWTDIHEASIVRVKDGGEYGYIIKLPKAYPLN